jgi:hypothetical protein
MKYSQAEMEFDLKSGQFENKINFKSSHVETFDPDWWHNN